MQIKDVEKLTGLTKKSIRYYEEEGLLNVKRDNNNDYREYSEDDVKILRKIHLYRFLDFSVYEIKELLSNEKTLINTKLQEKIDQIEKQNIEDELKKDICVRLMKNDDSAELIDEVETLNEENLNGIKEILFELSCTSGAAIFIATLILLAPIIWLFINISLRKWDVLYLNSIIAIASSLLLVSQWKNYLTFRKNHKDRLVKENKKNRFLLPVAIAVIILSLGTVVIIAVLQEKFLLPKDYLFYESPRWMMIMLIPATILLYFMLATIILNRFNICGMGQYDELLAWLKKNKVYRIIAIVLVAFVIYCGFTTVNVVCENRIVVYRPFDIKGEVYNYDEVRSIDARFKKNGDFFYTLLLSDRKIAFNVPSVNPRIERYQNDSYLELEELDKKLMESGIIKVSSDKYADNAMLDQVYIERFKRIINNR